MAYGDPVSDLDGNIGGNMDRHVVLDIGLIAHHDGGNIPTQDSIVKDRGVLPYLHIANELGTLGKEDSLPHLGPFSLVFDFGCHTDNV